MQPGKPSSLSALQVCAPGSIFSAISYHTHKSKADLHEKNLTDGKIADYIEPWDLGDDG